MDGSLPATQHTTQRHGCSVSFFADLGRPKYWVRATSPTFGFFFYHTLVKVVCPYLAAIFGMPIWHPTYGGEVDALLAAQVDVYVLQLRLPVSTSVAQSFDNKFCRYT
jgi:hypothetical protein